MNKEQQIKILNSICPEYAKFSSRALRHEFFEKIETEIQSYLLGFYVADGNLNLSRNTIRVKLSEVDKEIVDMYTTFISPSAHIKYNNAFIMIGPNGKNINVKGTWQVSISSKQLSETLQNIGYGERKTYLNLHLPNIKQDLIPHFIRGYFEGDGWITYNISKANQVNREKNDRIKVTFGIVSKTQSLLQEIQLFFKKHNITTNINYVKSKDYYTLTSSSRSNIINIFNLIYCPSEFKMTRKFEHFNKYVNTEVTQLIAEYRNA